MKHQSFLTAISLPFYADQNDWHSWQQSAQSQLEAVEVEQLHATRFLEARFEH